jgi:hypothetical protein
VINLHLQPHSETDIDQFDFYIGGMSSSQRSARKAKGDYIETVPPPLNYAPD